MALSIESILLNAEVINRQQKQSIELSSKPQISDDFISTVIPEVALENSELFSQLYLSYLYWHIQTLELEEEQRALQNSFLRLVEKNLGDYSWIVAWANQQQDFDHIALNDFWSGTIKVEQAPVIDKAYTLQGKAFINQFLTELAESNDESNVLANVKDDFQAFYDRRYRKAWLNFAQRFNEGKYQLRDRKEWLTVIDSLSTKDNPYFKFIRRMSVEMQHITDSSGFDGDNQFVFFGEVQDAAGVEVDSSSAGNNKAATKAGMKLLKKVCKTCGKVAKTAKKVTKGSKKQTIDSNKILDDSVKALLAYNAALAETAFNSESKTQSHSTITTLFTSPDNPGSGDNAMAAAYNAIIDLQKLMGKPRPSNKLFWDLYSGPMGVIYDYMEKENNCFLQDEWETQVLAEISGVEKQTWHT